MDPRTGAIIAMATVPRYNPNRRAAINPELERNRARSPTRSSPGSTFKVVTMAAALEDKKVQPSTRFDLPTPDHALRPHARGRPRAPAETLTASQILAQSSNIGTVLIAERVGAPTGCRPGSSASASAARPASTTRAR